MESRFNMNASLDSASARLIAALAWTWARSAIPPLTATLAFTVIPSLSNVLLSKTTDRLASRTINARKDPNVDTRVSAIHMGSALPTSHYLEAQVRYRNITVELYASDEQDLFLCSDGYGLLNSKGVGFLTQQFASGVYECGAKPGLKSLRAGYPCQAEKDCPTNINGTFATCDCTYSGKKVCGLLWGNIEFLDYIQAVRRLV